MLMESLAAQSKQASKIKMLNQFMAVCFKGSKHADVYYFLRLIVPQIDRQRSTNGMKESNLALIYANVLSLPPSEKDRLKNYKNPMKQPVGSPTGDFVGILMHVLANRISDTNSKQISIVDVNSMLDQLSKCFDNASKENVMHQLINSTSLIEQKWLVRIILKDMKIGMSHAVVLKHYHQEAVDLFNSTSDLLETCI